MDATCDFQEEKKGREKPQVMHIRLRIYHIFLSWSVSKLVYNLASVCVCVSLRKQRKALHPCQVVWSCVELSSILWTWYDIQSCVNFHCSIVLRCFVLCVYSHTAPDSSRISLQHWALACTQWQICYVRNCFSCFSDSNHTVDIYMTLCNYICLTIHGMLSCCFLLSELLNSHYAFCLLEQ